MINFEGGAIPEEYHTAYIVDRVNTTGTVWLGLTVGCAQCHDHKFDPITQKDYYQLYAFFNNVPENGLDGSQGQRRPAAQARRRRPQQTSGSTELDRRRSAGSKRSQTAAATAAKAKRCRRLADAAQEAQPTLERSRSRRRWSWRRCRSRATRSS